MAFPRVLHCRVFVHAWILEHHSEPLAECSPVQKVGKAWFNLFSRVWIVIVARDTHVDIEQWT